MNDQIAPKNHNNPPSELEFLEENINNRHKHAIEAAEGHIAIANQMPDHFMAQSEADYTTDFIKLMGNLQKELERRRKEEKEPFLRQGDFVDNFFNGVKGKLQAAIDRAAKPLQDWLQRKADEEKAKREADFKLLQEQQAAAMKAASEQSVEQPQERADAIQKAIDISQQTRVAESIAAAPITSMARSTGKTASAALKEEWVGTITDIDQLELIKLRPYISRAALDDAVKRYVKQGGRELAGAEIKKIMVPKVK
jgi:hypothetical protein